MLLNDHNNIIGVLQVAVCLYDACHSHHEGDTILDIGCRLRYNMDSSIYRIWLSGYYRPKMELPEEVRLKKKAALTNPSATSAPRTAPRFHQCTDTVHT